MGAKGKEDHALHSPLPHKKQKIKVRGLKPPPLPYYLLYFASPPPFLPPTANDPSRYVIMIPAIIAIATTIING